MRACIRSKGLLGEEAASFCDGLCLVPPPGPVAPQPSFGAAAASESGTASIASVSRVCACVRRVCETSRSASEMRMPGEGNDGSDAGTAAPTAMTGRPG